MSWQRTLAATAHITMHPAELVGKQRPMTDYRNHRTYTPTKTLKAEKAIKDAFRAAYGETFANHDGPVVMRISTTRPLAKSNPKYWEGRADLGKPDWDNLGKLACIANNLMFDATHPDNNDGETATNAYHVMIALCEAGLSRIDEKCVAKSREFIADKIKPVSEEEREFGRAFLAAVLGIK